jgi:hypothetical protein
LSSFLLAGSTCTSKLTAPKVKLVSWTSNSINIFFIIALINIGIVLFGATILQSFFKKK